MELSQQEPTEDIVWDQWFLQYVRNLKGSHGVLNTDISIFISYLTNIVAWMQKNPGMPRYAPKYSGTKEELLIVCQKKLSDWRKLEKERYQQQLQEEKLERDRMLVIEQEEEEERFWSSAGAIESLQSILAMRDSNPTRNSLIALEAEFGYQSQGENLNNALTAFVEAYLYASPLPNSIPHKLELQYDDKSTLFLAEQQLPDLKDMPEFRDYKYVASRDEWQGLKLPDTEKRKLYNSTLFQIALRTISEILMATEPELVSGVVFNGYVDSVDKSTGNPISPRVMSIMAMRDQFESFNLDRVDPKECFKLLKGISAANLADLAPVPPVINFSKADKRFIDGVTVSSNMNDSTNLATLDWQEFEHLIRELFEWEFAASGGEVKVTRASRDEGVDAVVFDPDPIRGGKIVIQAKRYTNTVELSAVRDLYGTVVNEGAIKGRVMPS